LGVTPSASSAKLQGVTRSGDVADATLAASRPSNNAPLPAPAPDPAPSVASKDAVKVPDAAGLAMRDAIRVISAAGLVPQVEGTGKLVRQAPAAGTAAAKGSAVRLSFEQSS
jgi:hypothetical protein